MADDGGRSRAAGSTRVIGARRRFVAAVRGRRPRPGTGGGAAGGGGIGGWRNVVRRRMAASPTPGDRTIARTGGNRSGRRRLARPSTGRRGRRQAAGTAG